MLQVLQTYQTRFTGTTATRAAITTPILRTVFLQLDSMIRSREPHWGHTLPPNLRFMDESRFDHQSKNRNSGGGVCICWLSGRCDRAASMTASCTISIARSSPSEKSSSPESSRFSSSQFAGSSGPSHVLLAPPPETPLLSHYRLEFTDDQLRTWPQSKRDFPMLLFPKDPRTHG